MSEDIIPYGSDKQVAIEKFQILLNQYPDKNDTKINTLAKGAKYLPIRHIERKLDEVYSGLWTTQNFRWQVVVNEIVGSIDLLIFHPIAKTWLTRTGAASKMILVPKDKQAIPENKIKNALETGFPALKAECLKNAAKSLGVVFGRSINNDDDDFTYLSEQVHDYTESQHEALQLLETAILTEKERDALSGKIEKHRYTHTVMAQVVEYLKTKQPA